MKSKRKLLQSATALTLCALLALMLCACGKSDKSGSENVSSSAPMTSSVKISGLWATATYTKDTELGTGKKTVEVEVEAGNRKVTFTVHTDEDTLGAALISTGLISGEQGEYGLYIKTVNGITADYDTDGAYWEFNSNGRYMMSGVDSTKISDGEHYELVYTK